ncbi:hypothetical protein [Aminicella lysinilytica]|nr:hypothetical protein [Aminicella lysinilytica]
MKETVILRNILTEKISFGERDPVKQRMNITPESGTLMSGPLIEEGN